MSRASLLEEWLLRSRQFPLSIYLKLAKPKTYTKSREDVMWKIMDLVARCSRRWQDIQLDTPLFFDKDKCFVPQDFSQLRSLSILDLGARYRDYDSPPISPLLDCLSAPALRDLSIHAESDGISPPTNRKGYLHTSLIPFILRSSCPLIRLDLFQVTISDAQLVECLTLLPSLRELELEEIDVGAHTVHKLAITRDQDGDPLSLSLLPNLTSLTIIRMGHIPFDFADLARMVRSQRWGMEGVQDVGRGSKPLAVAQMEAISVDAITFDEGCRGWPTVAALAQFQELEDEGMKVHLAMSSMDRYRAWFNLNFTT